MFQSIISTLGLAIGSGFLLFSAYQIQQFYTLFFHLPEHPLQKYKLSRDKNDVPWALITGSSAGIGFGYAQYLLSLGFGVIIFAHEGIEEADAKLRKAYPDGHIKSFTLDCKTASIADIERIVESVKELKVTVLINNVASVPLDFPQFRPFRDYDAQGIDDHWNLNARFMSQITRAMIPHLERNAQPRSLILNITSGGRIGMPYLLGYSATKAYVSGFSHTLSREFRSFGEPIDCLLIAPGDVLSHGNRSGVTPGSPVADDYAKMVLQRVDGALGRGMLEISPYWKHQLQIYILQLVPEEMKRVELLKIMELKKIAWAEEHRKR